MAQGINDYSVYSDYNSDRIVVQFPWAEDEETFDPETAISELGATAQLQFIEGTDTDEEGNPTGDVILDGSMVDSARAAYAPVDQQGTDYQWVVELTLNDEGTQAFATATSELASSNGQIAIWMDDQMISAPQVNEAITNGQAHDQRQPKQPIYQRIRYHPGQPDQRRLPALQPGNRLLLHHRPHHGGRRP